jgi:phosphate transport system permease protein
MRRIEQTVRYLIPVMALSGGVAFVAVLGYLVFHALPAVSRVTLQSLTAPLSGSILLVVLALLMAAPVGIGAGIYLGAYGRGRMKRWLSFWFELLASIPSILVGLFGFVLIMVLHRLFAGALPSLGLAAFAIAILIQPYIIKATQLGIEETPSDSVVLAYALGATREQVITTVMLPHALSHILKGLLLALVRAAEDTAVIMLTGAVASYGIPHSMGEPFEALPFFIYTTAAEYRDPAELGAVFVAALLLVGLAGIFVVLASAIRSERRVLAWKSSLHHNVALKKSHAKHNKDDT